MDGAWYNDASAPKYKYLYNGKELTEEFSLNFYDYGARWYDPGMASWWEVDPASEKNRRWSPYAYGNNNPVRFIDPDGRESSAYGGFTSSDEIAERNQARTDERDKKNWLQQVLDYLGVFTQPETEEEAAKYADRQERFTNVGDHLEKAGEELKSKAEFVPVLGGIANISQGAVKKDNTQVVLGMASLALDALPGGKASKAIDLIPTHGLTMSNREFKRFVQKVATNGITEPIKFIEHKGAKYVVDGHHRLRAANILKIDNVPVQKVDFPFGQYKTAADLIYSH